MIISHDLGTTGDKATLIDATGRVVAACTAAYGTDFGPRGKAEQDAEAWWDALCRATRDLIGQQNLDPGRIEAVSFSGQMMGALLLDGAGAPVRPAIIWADTRSTAQAAQLVARVGMERGYAITGHRLNPTYSLSKIMWVREHEPEIFDRARIVLNAKDFAAYRLTGVLATDPSDASSTNAFDQGNGDWSDELLAAAGLPRALFPEIVASTQVIGQVTAAAAAATGLTAGTPVVMGGGDGPMGALGAGIIDAPSGAYAYLGSSSWVSVAASAPLLDPQMRSMTFNHVIPGQYVPTATMQAGGASLEWVVDTLVPDHDRPDRFATLLDSAAQVIRQRGRALLPAPPPGGEIAVLEPGRARGLRRPRPTPRSGPPHPCRSGRRRVQPPHRAAGDHRERHRHHAQSTRSAGPPTPTLFLQMLADVWGVPVTRRNLVDEATAVGAAVVAGVGVGIFDDFDVARRFSAEVSTHTPDPGRHAGYGPAYAQFMDAYRRLEPWFDHNTADPSDPSS